MRHLLLPLLAAAPFVLGAGPLASPVLAQAVPTAASAATAATAPALADDDRVRLAEAFRLAAAMGDAVWPGWSTAPFAVLLVTPTHELLVRHPRPTAEFTRVGHDAVLGSDVWARPRTFAPGMAATFPAVAGVPTVVIGQPAATGKSSTAWVLTVLHEHFHQLQTSRPGYHARVDSLGLARGDQSGMWMLNFPFPYDSAAVQARWTAFARALDDALADASAATPDARAAAWRTVTGAGRALRAVLPPDERRYLDFQLWQEGVARYTELATARWAAEHDAPGAAFRALPDFTTYAAQAAALREALRQELRTVPLARARRVAFYPAGAATALLLDDVAPGWRARYFAGALSLDALTAP